MIAVHRLGQDVAHATPRTGPGGVATFKAQWSSIKATGVEFDVYALSANGNNATSGDGANAAKLPVLVSSVGAM